MQIRNRVFNRAFILNPTLTLLLILLLGMGLRLYRLGDQSVWWDEGHAIWTARQSLVETTSITAHDVHPPLYLWLLHFWLRLTGESEFAVRYLSLIGGVLTVALTYVVARRLIGRRSALLATLLIATARFHIWWSQEARMYVWAAFYALLSIYLFARLRHGGTRVWWAFVLASAAALYTLYLAVLVLLIENLFVALTVWRKPRRRRFAFAWIVAQLGVLALYAPWLYLALSRIRADVAKTSFPFFRVWQLYGTVLATGISTDLDRYTWLLVAFGLLIVAGIVLLIMDRGQPQRYGFAGWEIGLLLVLPLFLPPLIVYVLSIPRGFFYSPKPEARYLLLFAPFFYILLAGTIVGFWQRGRWEKLVSAIAAVLVLGTSVSVLPMYYAGRYLRNDYQMAMCALAAYARPEDAVMLVSGDRYPVFLYHYHRRFPDGDGPNVYLMPRHHVQFTSQNVDAELAPLHEKHERLWLASFERTLQDPENLVEGWMEAHRVPAFSLTQGHNSLRLYTTDGAEPAVSPAALWPQYPLQHELGNGLLLGYDLPTTEFRPGDVVYLGLYVRVVDVLDLVVNWVDKDGRSVSRQTISISSADQESDGASRITWAAATFAVYEYTTPGQYWFEVHRAGDDTDRVRFPAGRVTQSRRFPARKPAVQRRVEIGNGDVQFLGYEIRPQERVHAGGTLTIDLYWQAHRRLDTEYTVFVHLLGPYNPATGGPVWSQDDSYPLGGGHPTTRWMPEQIVPDRHQLQVPVEAPSGTYQVEVGLYDALTGTRLAVADDEQNRILIADVQVMAN